MGQATETAQERVTVTQRVLETEVANQIEAAMEAMQTINGARPVDPHHPETATWQRPTAEAIRRTGAGRDPKLDHGVRQVKPVAMEQQMEGQGAMDPEQRNLMVQQNLSHLT